MSALYLIKCNDCGETAKEHSTIGVAMARTNNRGHGWTSPKAGHDYCPECSKKRKTSGAAYY